MTGPRRSGAEQDSARIRRHLVLPQHRPGSGGRPLTASLRVGDLHCYHSSRTAYAPGTPMSRVRRAAICPSRPLARLAGRHEPGPAMRLSTGTLSGAGPTAPTTQRRVPAARTRARSRRAAAGRRADGPVPGRRRKGLAPHRSPRPSAGLRRRPPQSPLPSALGRARAGRPRRRCWSRRRRTTIRPCPATRNAGPAKNQHMRPGSCVQPSPWPEPRPEAPSPVSPS